MTQITLETVEEVAKNKLLNTDSPLVPLRCINAFLYYGRPLLVNHTSVVEIVLTNLNSDDFGYMPTKQYIIHSIIENCNYFLNQVQFRACLNLANFEEMYQIDKAKPHLPAQYGIILIGFIFRLEETMKMLEEKGIQDKVIQDIMANHNTYIQSLYDRKVVSSYSALVLGLLCPSSRAESKAVRFSKVDEDLDYSDRPAQQHGKDRRY